MTGRQPQSGTIAQRLVARANQTLSAKRVVTYPLLLLLVTLSVFGLTRIKSGGLAAPGGAVVGRDYLAFYTAGRMVDSGRARDLYDLAAQQRWQDSFMASANPDWDEVCLYLNPPHYAWAMRWISRLGYAPSLLMWWALSLAAFAGAAMFWRRWIGGDAARNAVLLAVCMPAWFQALAGGQNSFFSLLILTGFAASLIARRDWLAGLVLSLLAYKFQLILLPAALLLFKRRWAALGGLFAGGLLTLAITALTMGPEVVGDYYRLATNLGGLMQQQGFDVHKQHSWYGLFELALGRAVSPSTVRMLAVGACAGTLILVARVWRGPWAPRSERFSLQLAALFVATLVTSPHLFHYDMLLIVLPVMLWLRSARASFAANSVPPTRLLLAGGFVWLAAAGPLAAVLHLQFTPVLMFIWLLLIARRLDTARQSPVQPTLSVQGA